MTQAQSQVLEIPVAIGFDTATKKEIFDVLKVTPEEAAIILGRLHRKYSYEGAQHWLKEVRGFINKPART